MTTIQPVNSGALHLSALEPATHTHPLPGTTARHESPAPIGAPQSTSAQPSQVEIKQAIDRANKALESTPSDQIQFSIHDATGIQVVKLVDQQTGETIRQFPSEEILAIAESIDQSKSGAVVKQEA